jgi:hypothetical protein
MSATPHHRRESDRAERRAIRAAELGDHTAQLIATAQAATALRRRDEWELARLQMLVRIDERTRTSKRHN